MKKFQLKAHSSKMKFLPVTLSPRDSAAKIQLWNQTRILGHNLDQIIAHPHGLDLHQQVNNIYIRMAITKIITGDLNHVSNRWTMLQKSIKRSDEGDDSILDLDLENF